MVEDGALNGTLLGKPADMIFGLHGWTTVALGRVETLVGPMMASTDEFHVHVHGQGGHAAAPHTTIDPVVIAAHVVTALQSAVSRTANPFDPVVVTIGQIHSGTANNIIPMSATLHGTIRTMTDDNRALIVEKVRDISVGVCQAMGARGEFVHSPGYPVTSNAEIAVERFMRVAERAIGAENCSDQAVPTMGGEDFSFYGSECPACFFQLGLIPKGESSYPSVHTPLFDFNDDAIEIGMSLMIALALEPHL
jgi:amidohydrolase